VVKNPFFLIPRILLRRFYSFPSANPENKICFSSGNKLFSRIKKVKIGNIKMNASELKSTFGMAAAQLGVAGLGTGATLSCFMDGRIFAGATSLLLTAFCFTAGAKNFYHGADELDQTLAAVSDPPAAPKVDMTFN
jgi:hypothetical protein